MKKVFAISLVVGFLNFGVVSVFSATVNDTFTDTNNKQISGHVSDSGHSWALHTSTPIEGTIQANQVADLAQKSPVYYSSVVPIGDEYDVQVDVSGSGYLGGPAGRINPATPTMYVVWRIPGEWRLYKIIAGVETKIGSYAGDDPAVGAKTIKLQIRNASKKVFINGIERISSNDNSITGAGRAGFAIGGAFSERQDNFSFTDVGTSPVTPTPTATLTASPTSIAYNGTTGIGWTSTNTTSCTLSSGQTGTSGSFTTSPLTTTTTYTLTCTGAGGTVSKSVTVTVAQAPVPTDTTPPTLSSVTASNLTETGATITWITNESADTQVEYGRTSSYGQTTTLNTTLSTSHTATLSGLSAGTMYNYRVTSKDAAGNTTTGPNQTFTTPATPVVIPAPTATLTASPTSIAYNGTTGIGWTSTNTTSCTLSSGQTGTSGSFTTSPLTTTTTYTLTCTGAGGTVSKSVTVTVAQAPVVSTDTTVPTRPTALKTTALSTSQIALAWTASTDNVGVVGYKVFRGTAQVATSTGTSYQDIGLTAGTRYTYTVQAFDARGNLSTKSASSATTLKVITTPAPTDTTPPTTPTSLSASAVSSSQVNLTWTASTDASGVAGYKVFRGGVQIATTTTTSYSNTGLTPSTIYTYTVSAYDTKGNVGAQSLGASATTQASAPVATSTPVTGRTTYYISPTGSDTANGLSPSTPVKTFKKLFGAPNVTPGLMKAGDELVLLDGVYGEAQGTGYISYLGTNSGQIPSGTAGSPTYVRALNPGKVTVNGALFIGRSARKDSYINVQGITFEGGGSLYNTNYVTVKDSGFHGAFGVGTNDHDQGNTNNLVEDVWVWASGERIIAINYRAHNNVWRRVVVRGDGCGTSSCTGSGNPNVGITVYDSHDVSFQNVIVVDRVLLAGDSPYADFASAQHTADPALYYGRNEWLGVISIKAPDQGLWFEPDDTLDPTVKIVNGVFWGAAGGGINLARKGTNNSIDKVTVKTLAGNGIRVAPELVSGSLKNAVVLGSGSWGINSSYKPENVTVAGTWSASAYNQTTCSVGCSTTDPILNYPVQSTDPTKGANVLYRYGMNGSRYGEVGYNTLTNSSLWPWPNEDRIKKDMCASTTRGFCATGKRLDGVNPVTLTSYIWEQIGNPMPTDLYAGSGIVPTPTDTTPPTTPTSLSASAVSSSQVNLTWTASTDASGVAGYKVFRGGVQIATTTTTSYSNTGLTPSTIYTYTVSAYDTKGNVGAQSLGASATTQASAPVATSGTYYISPTGSDANAGTAGAPFTTFSKAWSVLKPGNTLIVKNGSYNQNIIPPQGFAGTASNPITIKAESDGGALVNGSAQLVTNSYLVFEGLKMKSSAGESVFDISNRNEKSSPSLATASHHITLRRMGLECPLSGNTVNDGSCVGISSGAHDNLIEDSWIWGGGRYSLLLYGRDGGGGTTVTGADRNTLRRLILRVGPNVSGGGQPQAALALYYASNNTIENVLALDGIASSDSSNSAFYITSHATPPNVSGNKFYGVIALNTQGTAGSKPTGFYLDVDNGGVSSNTEVHNSVFWNSGEAGLAVYNSLPANNQNMIINHVTSGKNGGSGYENYTNSVSIRSSLFLENKGYGLRNGTSGSTLENYNIIYGNTGSARSNVTVGANSLSVNPNLRYITRTEPSSGGKGTGEGGSDIGATVLYRYEDGSLTSSNLWPWPNEVRIKSEMCTGIYATRGFCASSSLTQYVWEAAGNSMPTDVTGNTTATTPTTAQSLATVPQTTTSPTPVTTTTQTTTIVFTRDLTVNDVGDDVKALQQFLNQQGFTIATTGAGSPGNETTTFGTLTQTALSKFQTTYGISPSTGYFGPVTCKKVMTINPPVSCTMAGI